MKGVLRRRVASIPTRAGEAARRPRLRADVPTRHYRHQKYVIGFDLRNELRGIPAATAQRLNLKPGGRYLRPDWSEASGVNWAAAAARAGRAVLEVGLMKRALNGSRAASI